jgi:hypothetical protein
MVLKVAALALAAVALSSCASPRPRFAELPAVTLVGPAGEPMRLGPALRAAPLTVLVFFSRHCHCLDRHEPRLLALYAEEKDRGVQFFMVDSEVGGAREADDLEARRRGYPFPILVDPGARLADLVGAQYATYSVVLDRDARVRYRGGIDTDRVSLRDDATPFLKDAIEDLLSGRAPRVASGKALGCALEKW